MNDINNYHEYRVFYDKNSLTIEHDYTEQISNKKVTNCNDL